MKCPLLMLWTAPTLRHQSAPNDPFSVALFSGAIGGGQGLARNYRIQQSGAVGGFEAGYNWQAGSNWLWGLEADFSFAGMSGTASNTRF
jgi:hypothetical protein